jgi:hypothetical protein
MAKHRRKWNESIYRKHLREGRGQGVGTDYTPWILVQDFASRGMVSRVRGAKTGRIHHLLSNLEMSFFYILDWSDNVIDIREQYPLIDIPQVIEIAESAQIRYPYDRQSGFPYIMTSDFYVDTIKGPVVVTIKASSELEDTRVREKLEIERRYWLKLNVKWKVVTEYEIDAVKARNIEWLSQAKDLGSFGIPEDVQASCCSYLESGYTCNEPLGDLFKEVEDKYDFPHGLGLTVYKHLAYWKRIEFDINKSVNFADFMINPAMLRGGRRANEQYLHQ